MSAQPSNEAKPEAAPATTSSDADNNETPVVADSKPDAAKPIDEEPKEVKPTELPASAPVEPVSAAPAEASPPTTTADETTEPNSASTTEKAQLSPLAQLWKAAEGHEHFEIWGVPLSDPERHIPTQVIFQKFLNANDGDVEKAKAQLLKTLDWRKKTQPQQLVRKMFSKTKFDGMGYVTTYTLGDAEAVDEPEQKEVFTWNLYGSVKSVEETFGNLQE